MLLHAWASRHHTSFHSSYSSQGAFISLSGGILGFVKCRVLYRSLSQLAKDVLDWLWFACAQGTYSRSVFPVKQPLVRETCPNNGQSEILYVTDRKLLSTFFSYSLSTFFWRWFSLPVCKVSQVFKHSGAFRVDLSKDFLAFLPFFWTLSSSQIFFTQNCSSVEKAGDEYPWNG
jgi:hypothetical protein